MTQSSTFTAQVLETSAAAYGAYAASLLLDRHPEIADRHGQSAMRDWKSHLTQRALELAAALDVDEPRLFASRVHWANQAFRSREIEQSDLRSSLECLRQILREELPPSALGLVDSYFDPALATFEQAPTPSVSLLDPNDPHQHLALRFLRAALEGDSRGAIETVVTAVDKGLSFRDAYLEVLCAAQREIGRLWHLGDLNIAEEHLVTTTTDRAMAVLSQRVPRIEAHGKTVLTAAVSGNRHGLGVRMLADFFEAAGWRSICLGSNVPRTDLTDAVAFFDGDLLVLSAALSTQLKNVRENIEAVRAMHGQDLKILVGGIVFEEAPELWQQLGADAYAPAADIAVKFGARLVGLDPES